MILEVLKTVGELVVLSQEFKTNKQFVSALIRRRPRTTLPVQMELSLGMRKYLVLLTDDRGEQTKYRPDLGRFILWERREKAGLMQLERQSKQEHMAREARTQASKGPRLEVSKGLVERGSRPDEEEVHGDGKVQ